MPAAVENRLTLLRAIDTVPMQFLDHFLPNTIGSIVHKGLGASSL